MKNYTFFSYKPHYKKKKIFKMEVLGCDSATTTT